MTDFHTCTTYTTDYFSEFPADRHTQHHPLTGVPSFFVHPCLLGDAMNGFSCAKEDYLMVWLGLVGGCVGLWIPKEMALATN